MSHANVLIAEADASAADQLKNHLEGSGYRVVGTAFSDQDTMHMIERAKPDIILMSIRLIGSQGGIRTGSLIHQLHDLPVVYMIDQGSQATIRRAVATGPFGYIFRPFDDKQIFATIETALIRHQLERRIQQSRQWLNTTLKSIGDGVIATDERGLIRFINPAAIKLTGWQQADTAERAFSEVFSLVDPTSHEQIALADTCDRSLPGYSRQGFEGLLRSKDGKFILVEANITPIEDGKGNVYGTVLVFRDITQQREATLEIKRQANRAEALVQAASQLNAQHDLETVLNTICEITNRTLQATSTVALLRDPGRDVFRNMAIFSKDQSSWTCRENRFEIPSELLQELLSGEHPVVVIQDVQRYSELNIYEDLKTKTLAMAALFQGSDLLGVLISVFAQKQYMLPEDEFALFRGLADQASSAIRSAELFEQVRAGRERQRKLAKSLVDVQEAERRHIAQELHDHLGQVLTGLQFMLENTKKQATGTQRSSLEEIQRTVSDVIGQVREMSLNLRPSMLDDMGLLPTLHWHIDRYTKQTGIHVNFHCIEFPERLPPEIETAAYRIVQEALTNVARYAQVREVFVGLVIQEKTLWVEILDKGKGFDSSVDLDRPTSGLGGMRERASLVGGYLTMRTFINQGTQILAALPLTEKPLERRRYDRNRTAR